MSDTPLQAGHRLMHKLIGLSFKKLNLEPTVDEYNRVSRVFKQAGGSWQRIFEGSTRDIVLLKSVLKVAATGNYFSRKIIHL